MSPAPWDYLLHLAWALPVLALQWLAGGRSLWAQRRAVLAGTLGPALLLSVGDGQAIRVGIWGFDGRHLLGLALGGVPLEEVLFFTVTALLVSQSVTLLAVGRAPPPGSRSS